MIRAKCKCLSLGLAVAWLAFDAPMVAVADVGEGKVNFVQNIDAVFKKSNFSNDYYTCIIGLPGPAAGDLISQALHGSTDHKSMPANKPWNQQTSSSAAGETTSQRMLYNSSFSSSENDLYVPQSDPFSDSQAADIGTDSREAFSQSIATLEQQVGITRRGTGLAPNSNFNIEIYAPAGAVHMEATHTGNAFGQARTIVSLTGKLEDSVTGIPPVNLTSIQLLSKEIFSDNTWDSPEASGNYHFNLPDWTLLNGASFVLTVQFKVEVVTYARAGPVPEPSAFCLLGWALGCLMLRRNRVNKFW